ncbi:MAG TPA: hypothetical protein VGB63_16835 [Pedobacter sp.]|jgi:hypothetical protein
MEDEPETSNSYIDKKGQTWTEIGNGISLTNYDGSPISDLPDYLKNVIIFTLSTNEDNGN